MNFKHGIVYSEPGIYAGWPANHGAWQWGDEFLVGFLRGRYGRKSMHNIREPFEKILARSLDGGETWETYKPNVDFECIFPTDPPAFELGGDTIIRACGVYDHGGDVCYEGGGFYLSTDRGCKWTGPYSFAGLERRFSGDLQCTARTCITDDGLILLSNGQRMIWGTDATFAARHDGERFIDVGTVCEDSSRAVMPAVAMVGSRHVALLRRRMSGRREGWIDAFGSDDGGSTWRFLSEVGRTGSRNGNPPAVIALPNGDLLAVFANRDHGSMVYRVSRDLGESWHGDLLRGGVQDSDDYLDVGYPRLFLRSDGTPVCVYYWTEPERLEQHIAWTQIYLEN